VRCLRTKQGVRGIISQVLFACKLAEGSQVTPHVIKIMGYLETLDKLDCELKDDLATDVIL
jgi:hypothetical protein